MDYLQITIIFGVIFIGFWYYINLAWKNKPKLNSFGTFFLGGRKIGPNITMHTNWGLGFSFANGFWFNVVLGYSSSLFVLYSGALWSISIILVGMALPYIRSVTRDGDTIHGFIGKSFGLVAQIIACVATSIGYILNYGFEIYFSAEIFSSSIGFVEAALPIALLLAGFSGLYCMIGGFIANAQTDKPQNKLGFIAVILLLVLLFIGISSEANVNSPLTQKDFGFQFPPTSVLFGLSTFLLLFNIIDMANWQMIASNSKLEDTSISSLRRSFYKSAIYQYFMPSIAGCVTGIMLRTVPNLSDNDLLPKAFEISVLPFDPVIAALILGFILLGLLSTSLSSGDTYLLAAIHTLSIDLFARKAYLKIFEDKNKIERAKKENKYIFGLRVWLIVFAVASVLLFYFWYRSSAGSIFQFQFVMYGIALSLLPAVIFGLWSKNKEIPIIGFNFWASSSIILGIIGGLIPYVSILIDSNNTDHTTLSPVITVLISTTVLGIGIIVKKLKRVAV